MTLKRFETDKTTVSCIRIIFPNSEDRLDQTRGRRGEVRAVSNANKDQRDQGMENDSRNKEERYPGCNGCSIQLKGGLLKLE